MRTFSDRVWALTDSIATMLVAKNQAYGNSAMAPLRVFSKADTLEQLKVRIDDKLSRISNIGVGNHAGEDTIVDLIGYLIILKLKLQEQELDYDEEAPLEAKQITAAQQGPQATAIGG